VTVLVALAVGLAAGIFASAALAGVVAVPFALAGGLAAAAATAWAIHARRLLPMDDSAASRGLKVLSAGAAAVALVQMARLAVFMVDPSQVAYSTIPGSAWESRHSCLSAYFVAGETAAAGGDIYDEALYSVPDADPTAVRKPRMMGRFGIDVFEYPPPFLLLPRALRLATTDFFRTRPIWFGLNGAVILLAMLVVARRLGPRAGTRAVLLIPLVWAGLPMASMMQKGNVQAMVVALAMLAMALLERRRIAAGAALLAYAIASKLYPGLLVVHLLVRRQWRAVALTAAFGVALAAAALIDLGWRPYAGFVDHLPLLLSGEAFPALRNPRAMAINYSIPGLAFKAKILGVPGMGFGVAKVLGWIFTVVILWATVKAARRDPSEVEKPLVWLAVLVLATLRSPFLPQAYAALPPLWLLTLLVATYTPAPHRLALVAGGWLAFNMYWPLDSPLDTRVLAAANAVPQALTVVVAVFALRRRVEAAELDRDRVPAEAAAFGPSVAGA
jgi:hypothetical protein